MVSLNKPLSAIQLQQQLRKTFYCCKALRLAKFVFGMFRVQTVIRDSMELNILAMMFNDVVKLHSLARIRECFAKDSYMAYHAVENKQKRIIQHSWKLVKLEPNFCV